MGRKKISFPIIFLTIIGLIFFGIIAVNLSSPPERDASTQNALVQGLFKEREHYRGTPNVAAVIVEYGEIECPYCKDFHYVMKRIMGEYEGEVAWIYRHFPLASHPKSIPEAVALECISEIAGEELFWKYMDALFAATPSNNKMDLALLSPIAVGFGVPQAPFEACLSSDRHNEKIQNDRNSGVLWGATKVPHVVIVSMKTSKEFPISGGAGYQVVKNLIDLALAQE